MKEQIFTERSVSLVNRNESTPILTEFGTCPVAPGSAAPAAYLRMMQDVGEQHLAACGYPMKDMLARGESMMLSRSALRILLPGELPDRADTRQFAQHGVRASRVFEFYRGSMPVAEAINECFCISLGSRRIFRPVWLSGAGEPFTPQFIALERLSAPASGTDCGECTVQPDMIDYNGHVNNACYADFVQTALQTAQPPRELHLHYEHELLPGSTFRLFRSGELIWGAQGGHVAFLARAVL